MGSRETVIFDATMVFRRIVQGAVVIPAVTGVVNYDEVRADIRDIMNQPSWDDGSYAPILIRLAWHSSATYNKTDGTGGSNGATMRFAAEAHDPNNAGLENARAFLEPIKNKHPDISYSDLWILASYAALEVTDGPYIEFTGGRVDAVEGDGVPTGGFPGRLPDAEFGLEPGLHVDSQNRAKGWEKLAHYMRNDIFGHAYGRCHKEFTGFEGTWMNNPIRFDNEYVADMIDDTWVFVDEGAVISTNVDGTPNGGRAPADIRPAQGKRQYADLVTMDPTGLVAPPDGAVHAMRSDDGAKVQLGHYKVITTWMTTRQEADVASPLLAYIQTNDAVSVIATKDIYTADGKLHARGLTSQGDWVGWLDHVVGAGDFWDYEGSLSMKKLSGGWRMKKNNRFPAPVYSNPLKTQQQVGYILAGQDFECRDMHRCSKGNLYCQLDADRHDWVIVYNATSEYMFAEQKIKNYNDKEPRVPIKDQFGHQMMLPSDMVLKWDASYRKYMDIYHDDLDQLKSDFAVAFKKLTELGCPWTKDEVAV